MNDARSPQSAELREKLKSADAARSIACFQLWHTLHTHATCKLHGSSDVETASEEEMKKQKVEGGESDSEQDR